jgi:hypothetical protein
MRCSKLTMCISPFFQGTLIPSEEKWYLNFTICWLGLYISIGSD